MSPYITIVSSCILVLLSGRANAITYTVVNSALRSAPGARFEKEIGSGYALKKLSSATELIFQIFNQTNNPSARKPGVDSVRVHITFTPAKGRARTFGNEITISAFYIDRFIGDLKHEITGTIYHEMTHVLQWTDNGKAPAALIEGIADYVKIKAGYAEKCHGFREGCPPVQSVCHKKKPGDGHSWTDGGEFTAYFLDYCDGLRPGFVGELNARMKTGFDLSCFKELLGKPIDQLWDDYKAKYKH